MIEAEETHQNNITLQNNITAQYAARGEEEFSPNLPPQDRKPRNASHRSQKKTIP
jgi:hypothetical protein